MSRVNAAAAVEARQRREQFMQDFNASKAVEQRDRLKADWEVKGDTKIAQRQVLQKLDRIQAQHKDTLVARRARLAELLLREKERYEQMMSGLAETDDERRERLIRKARELREKREEQKKIDNQSRHDRLFREKIDPLRLAESRLKVMQVADERYQQLELPKQRREEEKAEEEYFNQQAAEAQRLANERAQRDLELRYQRTERLKGDLASQVEGNRMRRDMERQEKERDDAEFYRLLHEERVVEAQKKAAQRSERERIGQEMRDLNEELERARKQEYEQLKKEDRELLDSILAEIAVEKQRAQEEKLERKNKQKQQMEDMQRQMAQKKEDDHSLDKLWEEANEREWAKREKQWNADQKRRDQLLRNILIARRQQVMDKRQQRREEQEQLKQEHAAFLDSLQNVDDIDEKERQRRMAMLKETQQYLDMQIAQKRQQKEEEHLEWLHGLTDQEALEKENEDRIARELAALEAARPDRYRNIPLLPPKSRNQPF
ncbi:coiled-coil domain containing 11 [Angomonas deanei]|nr:coiled-coil domain containing 11 [Angomonas deanei]|eukprot:EPY31328.1 coiled-coil domain containing 11 [Angomonas deanei]